MQFYEDIKLLSISKPKNSMDTNDNKFQNISRYPR